MWYRFICVILLSGILFSCGKENIDLSSEEMDDLSIYMEQAENWSYVFIDKALIPYGAFAPETKTPASPVISTEESRSQINQFIIDLEINNDRDMHDWLINYGILIREIKVSNVASANESFFKELSSKGLNSSYDPCVIETHAVLQRHAYHKALSYASTTQSVNGPAFDLNNFMTLRGIGSGLYRIHRFIEARNECR